jgi:predicted RecB family nuclease
LAKKTNRSTKTPYLTKSRFMGGLDCTKLLWMGFHEPAPYTEPEPGSIQAVGIEVGLLAHQLFPGGVLVDKKPWEHQEAVEQTTNLMADPKVPAIFEATFEFDGVRVRSDVVERLSSKTWRLYEVKSSKGPKGSHFPDLAIQAYVMAGNGLNVKEIGLIHINGDYLRGPDGLEANQLLNQTDLTEEVLSLVPDLQDQVQAFHQVLAGPAAPEVEPGRHCPSWCDFWDQCTANKPEDWLFRLPNLRVGEYEALLSQGYQSISQIPDEQPLSDLQTRVRDAHRADAEFVSDKLAQALDDFDLPAYYLDFETLGLAIPVYPGTRPYQRVPFQWSVHHLDQAGNLTHEDFLADGPDEPRRALAEALIEAVGDNPEPIIVFTSFEAGVIRDLARDLPDLEKPLLAMIERLQDLHKLVKTNFYHPGFVGSFSIKAVGPALVPDLGYDKLEGIAEGMGASAAFYGLTTDQLGPDQDPATLKAALLAYCELDTMAMVRVHRALLDRAGN